MLSDLLKGVFRATGLSALKARFWRYERVLPDGSRLAHRSQDICVIDEIYEKKVYERGYPLAKGDTVIDLGGHIGVFTLLAAKQVGPQGRVITCEPGPDNLPLLRKNVAANGLSNVKVLGVAVGDKEGSAQLFIADRWSDNALANTIFPSPGRKRVTVPMRTLDAIVAEERLSRIDLLKIDVEGAELIILAGARAALAMTKHVVMELHPGLADPGQAKKALEDQGFSCTVSSESGSGILYADRV